jgi:LuxR family maltose regulon positive regulatory protein
MNRSAEQNNYISPRLKEQLSRITAYPLSVLEAPMGYGKTTAIRAYFASEPVKIGWLNIFDGFSSSFWKGFVALVEKMDAECARELIQLDLPSDEVTHQIVKDLLGRIQLRYKYIMVIDDYHFIENHHIHQLMIMMAKLQIPNLHVVLTLRRVPIEGFDELVLKGKALHLQKDVLEFNIEDIRKYFKLSDIQLTTKEAQALLVYTEGWISALYLYKMSYLKEGKLDDLQPQGNIPTIYGLLESAVVSPLTQQEQDLLIQLACFDSFTLKQAEHIWHTKQIGELLKKLVNQNAFISYDPKTKVYQMHNILTNYLTDKFNELPFEERHQLQLKIADWYEITEDYLLAMRYYYKAGNFEGIAKVLIKDKGYSLHPEQKDLIIKYYGECPEEVKYQYPMSLLVYGLALFTFNELDRFGELCKIFPIYVNENPWLDEKAKTKLLGEYELLFAFSAYNDINTMNAHHQRALDLLKGPSEYLSVKEGWTMGSPSVLYMFHRETGRLQQTVEDMNRCMPTYYALSNNHGFGAEHMMTAEAHFYAGNFLEGEIECHKSRQMARIHRQNDIILCSLFLELRCIIAQGRPKDAQEALVHLKEFVASCPGHSLTHTVDLCEGYIQALLYNEDKAPKWILDGNFNSERLYLAAISLYHTVYCRLLLNHKQYTRLLGEVDHFIDTAKVFPNQLAVIMLTLYKAAAYEQIYRRKEAMDYIREAFDMAMPDSLYMCFVETAPFILHLLDALSSEEAYRWDASRIKTLFRVQTQNAPRLESTEKSQQLKPETPKKAMTEREHEIAMLAAIGLSNKAIAEQLFISENTVKTTLKSIFEKLEIKSRAQLKGALQ